MKARTIPAHDLTADQIALWSGIQRANPALQSPFLCPEFVLAVAGCRRNVEVLLIEENARVVGFLPFQRGRWGVMLPVLPGLSEGDAVILGGEHPCDVRRLLASCRLTGWRFEHLIEEQARAQHAEVIFGAAPFIGLADGFEAYAASRRAAGSGCIHDAQRKQRKLERDSGPLRFELDITDRVAFEKLLLWKGNQNRRTGLLDIFQFGWVRETLEAIWRTRTAGFAGRLSGLYVGDELAAVHLGPCSPQVSHLWFTTYDPQFARFSPGIILLLEMARGLANEGVTRIELGPGSQRYKQQLKTGDLCVARGVIDRSRTRQALRRSWNAVRHRIRSGPLRKVAQVPANLLHQVRQWHAFRYAK